MNKTKFLATRSDVRLAEVVGTKVIINLAEVSSVLDIGCGDGAVSKVLPDSWKYRGVDLSNSSIYKQSLADKRIEYCSPGTLNDALLKSRNADVVLLLDVLEHTKSFTELFVCAISLANKYVVVSLPNELFFLDRIRMLAGKELPAHSLDLIGLPEGFKHHFVINIEKAKYVHQETAAKHGIELSDEWQRALIAKGSFFQPFLWLLRKTTPSNLWSMGNIMIFRRIEHEMPTQAYTR